MNAKTYKIEVIIGANRYKFEQFLFFEINRIITANQISYQCFHKKQKCKLFTSCTLADTGKYFNKRRTHSLKKEKHLITTSSTTLSSTTRIITTTGN